jgi:hypothetical protein
VALIVHVVTMDAMIVMQHLELVRLLPDKSVPYGLARRRQPSVSDAATVLGQPPPVKHVQQEVLDPVVGHPRVELGPVFVERMKPQQPQERA